MNNDRIAAIRANLDAAYHMYTMGYHSAPIVFDALMATPDLLTEIDRLNRERLSLVDIAGRYEQLKEKHKKLMADADNLESELAASKLREQAAIDDMQLIANCRVCAKECGVNEAMVRKNKGTCKWFEWRGPQEGGE